MLNGYNDSITVKLTDQFGRIGYDTVKINYFQPPLIKIIIPQNNIDTSASLIIAGGTTVGGGAGDTVELFVNGILNSMIIIADNISMWSGTVAINGLADSISAKLTDRFGRTAYDTISINYYGNPKIFINYPVNSNNTADTNLNQIYIKGKAISAYQCDSVYIYCGNILNSITEIYSENLLFSGTVSLNNQANTVFAVLKNYFGEYDTDYIKALYLSDLSVAITSPDNNIDTNLEDLIISGTSYNSQPNDTVTLFVNAIENSRTFINSLNGNWSGTVKLNSQNDKICVKILDKFGRHSYDTITINKFGNISVNIQYPFLNYDTFYNFISVSGTSYNTLKGDTLYVYVNGINHDSVVLGLNGDWSCSVSLSGINDTISVRIFSKFGLSPETWVIVNYLSFPQINIISPAENIDTCVQIISISGTSSNINGPDTIQLFTNGVFNSEIHLDSLNSEWSGTVKLSGYNEIISAKLSDQFGRLYFDTIILSYINNPVVEILYPDYDFYETMVQIITVSGTSVFTRAGDTVEAYVNGVLTDSHFIISDSGNWILNSIKLSGIGDELIIKLTDRFGRIYFDSASLNFYKNPDIKINYPDLIIHDTMSNIILISGTTSNSGIADTVEIFVNSMKSGELILSSFNGSFSGTVELSGIDEKVSVRLRDRFGRYDFDTITINYFLEPSIKISSPENNSDTTGAIVSINGTTAQSQINDRVEIFCNNILNSDFIIQSINGGFSGTAKISGLNDSITVILTDQFNRQKSDSLSINFIKEPIAVLNYPVHNDTFVNNIVVSGTTGGTLRGDTIEFFVNDNFQYRYNIQDYNGFWSAPVFISSIGDSLLLKLTNAFGRIYYDTIIFNYFDAPSLKIIAPKNNCETSITTISILGTSSKTHPADNVKLYVNSVFQSSIKLVSLNSQWSGTVKLVSSCDSVVSELTDRFGRKFYDTIAVNYLMFAPKIEILSPVNYFETSVGIISVFGTSSYALKNDAVYIYINNILNSKYVLTENNGLWSGTAALTDINDTLSVKIENSAGKIDMHNLNVSFINIDTNNSYLIRTGGDDTAGDTGIYKLHLQTSSGKNISGRTYSIKSDLLSYNGYIVCSGITDDFGNDTIYFYNTKSGNSVFNAILNQSKSEFHFNIITKPSSPSQFLSYFSGENQGFGDGTDITDIEFNIIDKYGNCILDRIVKFDVSGDTSNISIDYSYDTSDKSGKVFLGMKSSAPCSVNISVADITASRFDYSNTQTITFKEGLPVKINNVGNKNLIPGDSNALVLDFEISTSFDNDVLNKIIVSADISGNYNLNDVKKIKLWIDNSDKSFQPNSDTLIGESFFNFNSKTAEFIDLKISLSKSGYKRFYVSYDIDTSVKYSDNNLLNAYISRKGIYSSFASNYYKLDSPGNAYLRIGYKTISVIGDTDVRSNEPFDFSVSAIDTFGNLDKDYNKSVTISVYSVEHQSVKNSLILEMYPFKPADNGYKYFDNSCVLFIKGEYYLSIDDGKDSAVSPKIFVKSGYADSFVFSEYDTVYYENAKTGTLKIITYDACGNLSDTFENFRFEILLKSETTVFTQSLQADYFNILTFNFNLSGTSGDWYIIRVIALNSMKTAASEPLYILNPDFSAPAPPELYISAIDYEMDAKVTIRFANSIDTDVRYYILLRAEGVDSYFYDTFITNPVYPDFNDINLISDLNVNNGQKYYYKVYAVDFAGNIGDTSPAKEAVPNNVSPAAPIGLIAEPLPQGNSVKLNWTPNTEADLLGYTIYRRSEIDTMFLYEQNDIAGVVYAPISEFIDSGLENLKTYYYKVKSFDNSIPPNYSEYSQITAMATPYDIEPPYKPDTFNLNNEYNHIALKWAESKSYDVVIYQIFKSTKEEDAFEKLYDTVQANVLNYNDYNCVENQKYFYAIRCMDSSNLASEFSNVMNIVYADAIPPNRASSFSVSVDTIQLSTRLIWTDNNNNGNDTLLYNIYRNNEIFDTKYFVEPVVDKTIKFNESYTYKILIADNAGLKSEFLQCSPVSTEVIPDTVSDFKVYSDNGVVKLKWSDNSIRNNDIEKYLIFRKQNFDSEFYKISETDSMLFEFDDTDIVNDTYYYYYISVLDKSGYHSENSLILEAFPQMVDTLPPAPVSDFKVINGISQIELYWTPSVSADAAYYKIYRTQNLADTVNPNNDITTLLPQDTMFIDAANLDFWETYYYTVAVFDFASPKPNISYTEVLNGLAEDNDTEPPLLNGFSFAASDSFGIMLNWYSAADSSTEIIYKIYRNNILIFETINSNNFYDSAEINNVQQLYYNSSYNYKIFAIDKAMNYSNPIEVNLYFIDYLPPVIEHLPVSEIIENNKIILTAKISDKYSSILCSGKIEYYHSAASSAIKELQMTYSTTFTGEIPANEANSGHLFYRILAEDASGFSPVSYYPSNGNFAKVSVNKPPVLITDTTPPELEYVQDAFVLSAGETLNLIVKAYDNSDSKNLSVKLYFGLDAFNEEIYFEKINSNQWKTSVPTYGRNSGIYKYYIAAEDDSGNIGYAYESGISKNSDNPYKIKIWAKPESLRTVINYPNPWPDPNRPEIPITIRNLPMDKSITIKIFTLSGDFVRELRFGSEISDLSNESCVAIWDGKNNKGKSVVSGSYIYIINSSMGSIAKRITIIK